jgi:hypothetical protein
MHRYLCHFAGLALAVGLIALLLPARGWAQAPATPDTGPLAQGPPPAPGEREIRLEREHPLDAVGLGKPEVLGFRISGFFLGSANYNDKIQIVPEFAGGAFATSEPGQLNFSFDKFTIGVYRTFAPWLSTGASIAIEQHKLRHSHFTAGPDAERFGAEEVETEVDLHRFNITAIAPLGNGLAFSFGRFDTPYGYERHDANLNFTATVSELQQFGRPQSMTGFTAAYQFAPWLDAIGWVVNRWENETTHDDFNDNNNDKSFGGRIGFTPVQGRQLLNFGIGGWWGPEQDDNNSDNRWIVDLDLTWTPMPKLVLAAEFLYGGEQGVSLRQVGSPVAAGAVSNKSVNWLAFYGLAHYDVTPWLGLTFRYGIFDDPDSARTGVKQVLQSFSLVPTVRLSRLIPDLRPVGATYARTRHPLDWVDVKLEYRFNVSDRNVFSDASPGVPITDASKTSQQVTLQFVVNF